jgi:hypothetical protein
LNPAHKIVGSRSSPWQRLIPEIALDFLPSHCDASVESCSIRNLWESQHYKTLYHKAFGLYDRGRPHGRPRGRPRFTKAKEAASLRLCSMSRTVRPIANTAFFKMIDRGRWQRTIFEFRIDSNLHLVAVSREPAPASEGPGVRMGHFSSGASPSLAFMPATQSAQIHFWDSSAYKCINYSVLPNASIWHYICTLDFSSVFGDQNGDVMPTIPRRFNEIKTIIFWESK